eukprot:gb/GECH01007508.1/.p1 GENE.gb/GECH01007508.1/~~gb/GECH01007508.1/.p1  ORF type:complete len:300 (+),score=83.13 gb/GECH01007508.1/:1-900(+)
MSNKQLSLPQIAQIILSACRRYPTGLPQGELQNALKGVPQHEQQKALSALLEKGRLRFFKDNDMVFFKEVSANAAQTFASMSREERITYQFIESAGNMGIWKKHLRKNTNIPERQLNQVIKKMLSRQLIKEVKSVAAKNRTVLMLYETEPSREVTGGVWYSDQHFNTELVEKLQEKCLDFIKSKGMVSTDQVTEYVGQAGISPVHLRSEDIQNIVDVLVFDGEIEEISDHRPLMGLGETGEKYYKATRFKIPSNKFTQIPCGTCPVFDQCHEGGDISPSNCVYYDKWIDMETQSRPISW